jgi:putative transposase
VRLDRNQGGRIMRRKRYTPEEIIQQLRTVELETGKGLAVLDACRKLGITEHTHRPLEEGIRRATGRSSQAAEGGRAGKSASQADCRRPSAGSLDPEGGRFGKLLSPARRREAVGHAVPVLHVSERRACRAIGQVRASYRYRPQRDPSQKRLRERILALAKEYGRYGYRTVTGMLQREGWEVGKDRVYPIWRHEGLTVPQKQPKRAQLWRTDGSCLRLRPERPNHVWSYDFVAAWTQDGRPVRILNVLRSTPASVWLPSWPDGSARTTCG